MKPFDFLSFIISGLLLWNGASIAQTAEGGCSSVRITGGVPLYPNNAWVNSIYLGHYGDECNKYLAPGFYQPAATAQFSLQMLGEENWITVRSWQPSSIFNDVEDHGWYRVAIRVPQYIAAPYCLEGKIRVYNAFGQFYGYAGEWAETIYSNWVVVGETEQDDISWEFVDPNGNDLFNPGDVVRMNTTGTKNYDNWWVAIFENGGQNRYWSNGWTGGLIPDNEINLTQEASEIFQGGFAQIPVSYTVQFAITSTCDTEWTHLDRNFAVCPQGWGCRTKAEDEVVIVPNPASVVFSVTNLDEAVGGDYQLTLTDMNGRIVKTFSKTMNRKFDISDIPSGLYLVNILNENIGVYTLKLSIIK